MRRRPAYDDMKPREQAIWCAVYAAAWDRYFAQAHAQFEELGRESPFDSALEHDYAEVASTLAYEAVDQLQEWREDERRAGK